MSEHIREQISSIMDGEGITAEGLAQLGQNDSSNRTWQRYHLISDCMKGNMPAYLDPALSARISRVIAEEPTILAPQKLSSQTLLKPVAGFAIAASVAAVAILGIQQHQSGSDNMSAMPPQLASTADDSEVLRPITVQAQLRPVNVQTSAPAESKLTREELDARLNSYLVNYNEYRTHTGMQGMLPYVRVVAHGKNK